MAQGIKNRLLFSAIMALFTASCFDYWASGAAFCR